MQWFDEHDYDQSKFLSEQKFETEKKAVLFINSLDLSKIQNHTSLYKALQAFLSSSEGVTSILDHL